MTSMKAIKRYIDSRIRYCKNAHRVNDILTVPGVFVVANLIMRRIGGNMIDKKFVNSILEGKVREDAYVKNIARLLVDDIDQAIASGKLNDETQKAKQLLRASILKAHTIKDLLAVVPNNKMLLEADRLFTRAKSMGHLA